MNITQIITNLDSLLIKKLSNKIIAQFGETSIITTQFNLNPTIFTFSIILAIGLILLVFATFVEFVHDSWKMVFGILLDIFAFIAFLTNNYLIYASAFTSFIIFIIILNDKETMKWIFGITSAISIILSQPLPFIPPNITFIIGLIPISTILMFIACLSD